MTEYPNITVVVLSAPWKEAFGKLFDGLPGRRFENAWAPCHWTVPEDMTGTARDNILQTDRSEVTRDISSLPEPQARSSDIDRNTKERLKDLNYI